MMKFQNKTIQCGYHGTKLLKEVKVGTKTVCSSVIDDSQYFPQPPSNSPQLPHTDKFIVLVKSYIVVDYTPQMVLESVTSNSWSTWSVKHYVSGNDAGGNYHWYKIACTSPVATFKMKAVSAYKVIIVERSWDNSFNLQRTSFERCFIGMNKLYSCEFTDNVGQISNFHDIFARNAVVEYVKFLPQHFGYGRNFHGIFFECSNLKYVTYLDTSIWGSSGGFDRTYMFDSCTKLVRPSTQEQAFLKGGWGGITKFSFSERFMGVTSLNLYITRTHNNAFVTLGDILFFDDQGNQIKDYMEMINQSATAFHGASNLIDNDVNTYWQTSSNVPQNIWFVYRGIHKISQIRMRARTNNSWSHPLDFIWRSDPRILEWDDGRPYVNNQQILNMPEWHYTEWRSILIDPA